MTIPFSSIIEGRRLRKDYGDLSGLKESLKRLGIIHPIVLSRVENKVLDIYTLVAGGRRYTAMKELGVTELHHGSVLVGEYYACLKHPDLTYSHPNKCMVCDEPLIKYPAKYGFLFKDEVPEDALREAELDENVHRLATKWHEDVIAVRDIHELKRKLNGSSNWGEVQTAALLGKGYSRTNVGNALRVAKAILSGDKEVLSAETFSDAIAVLAKQAEEVALRELARRVPLPKPASTNSFLETINLRGGKSVLPPIYEVGGIQMTKEGVTIPLAAIPYMSHKTQVPLSQMFRQGDCIDLLTKDTQVYDHIICDPPYGIDMSNLTQKDIADVVEEHDVEDNIGLVTCFLVIARERLKAGGFCVFFYDLDHHEKLQSHAQRLGFSVQRWPFIATKTSACANGAAQYNTTKNYECAMFLRKGNAVLRKQSPTSWKPYDFRTDTVTYNNKFAKPFQLWKDIFDLVAFPGQTVLDPFAGEMSSCRAAATCGLVPYGIELKENHYLRGLQNMKATYETIYGKENVEFV